MNQINASRDTSYNWTCFGYILLFIAIVYFFGDVIPILRTFEFWAITGGVLMLVAVILHLKIKKLLQKQAQIPELYWRIINQSFYHSGLIGFMCLITGGYVVLIFYP